LLPRSIVHAKLALATTFRAAAYALNRAATRLNPPIVQISEDRQHARLIWRTGDE
jgi:hypothetical protein